MYGIYKRHDSCMYDAYTGGGGYERSQLPKWIRLLSCSLWGHGYVSSRSLLTDNGSLLTDYRSLSCSLWGHRYSIHQYILSTTTIFIYSERHDSLQRSLLICTRSLLMYTRSILIYTRSPLIYTRPFLSCNTDSSERAREWESERVRVMCIVYKHMLGGPQASSHPRSETRSTTPSVYSVWRYTYT